MKCKWCTEGVEVLEGERCPFCGTVGGEDRPKLKEIDVVKDAPEKLKIPLKEVAAKETPKKKK